MLKKAIAILTLSLFTTSIITACGSNSTLTIPADQQVSQIDDNQSVDSQWSQSVQTNSFSGVYKEIKKASELSFRELDTDKNKFITPLEYGVGTPDSQKAFYALDDNHDGKIVLTELMPGFFKRVGLTFRVKSAADALFKELDKNKDKFISKDELTSGLVSSAFLSAFDKYDKQKKSLFHNDKKGALSKSEFEDLFTSVAFSNAKNTPTPVPSPAPTAAPAEPPVAPPAPAEPPPAAPPASPAPAKK